jgi:diguanylate cyclase (GGDEF)-like protein/PAS domain S-box-containing protein
VYDSDDDVDGDRADDRAKQPCPGVPATSQTPVPSSIAPLRLAGARLPRALAIGGGLLLPTVLLIAVLADAAWRSGLIVAGTVIAAALAALRLGRGSWRIALPSVRRGSAAPRAWIHEGPSPTLVVGPDGQIRFGSETAAALLGYPMGSLETETLATLVSPTDAAAIRAIGDGPRGGRDRRDSNVRKGDGTWLPVELDIVNLTDDPTVGGLLVAVHDVSRWKLLEASLTDLAFHDALTRLPNRALFINRLEHALGRRRRHTRGTGVLFVDLDDFKTVNDSLGHVDADAALMMVADRLLASIRPDDTPGRLGGDEFAVLLDDVDEADAEVVAQRILRALEAPFVLSQRSIRIGGSIGIAHTAAGLLSSSDLLRAADIAMYHAKEAGKNQVAVFDASMQDASSERLSLGIDLRGAIDRGEFVLHYQPIVALPDRTVVAMEALIRWVHPERGIISPAEFIPIAERTGLMVPIGEWVVREACRQARAWQIARPGQPPISVNVNVSGVQLQHPGLVAAVSLALEDADLLPELLTIEITESVIARETDATSRRLRQLKGLGVGLAIDDFGTGYSSLSYLRRFPIEVVKIDKSFLDGIADDPAAGALTRGIVQLAHSLRTTTVAEGVETEAQLKRLIKMRCDRAQGFLFARPMDARAATEYVVGRTILSLWVGHVGPELTIIRSVVADFERLHPDIQIDLVGGVTDERIQAALEAADPPAVVSSFEAETFGSTTSVGKMVDLSPFLARDGIVDGDFIEATLAYTGDERGRWALPVLADTYGLLFNRAMFAETGIGEPPRTFDALTALAKRLTVRNPDGSLRVVGFDPTIGFYENSMSTFGHLFGARWRTDGRSSLATDPAWTRLLEWQRDLVDWYGRDDLAAFHAQNGDEFSTANAFQAGRLAMCLDGEWRVAFIAVEAEELDYGTAPLPVDGGRPELFGSGYINGSVIGIPRRARHREAAWGLVRYLATDEAALAKLSNGLRNVPSTRASLRSPILVPDERFAVFLDIFAHARSASAPMTPIGSSYQAMFEAVGLAWQDGAIDDLGAALRDLDAAIDGRIDEADGRADGTAGVTRAA